MQLCCSLNYVPWSWMESEINLWLTVVTLVRHVQIYSTHTFPIPLPFGWFLSSMSSTDYTDAWQSKALVAIHMRLGTLWVFGPHEQINTLLFACLHSLLIFLSEKILIFKEVIESLNKSFICMGLLFWAWHFINIYFKNSIIRKRKVAQ